MNNKHELEQLKERIDSLEVNTTSKQEISSVLADLRSTIKSVEDKLALSERFSKIEQEHQSWKTLATYITLTVSVLGILLGYLGFSSMDKFLRAQVDKRFDYFVELGYGLSLADKHASFAIPHLMRCFQVNHFDEPLLITLLTATDNADDWDTARIVMQELRKAPLKVNSFSNALTYNNIGIAELNLGFENSSHFALAHEALRKGIQLTSGNQQNVLWYLHTNLWRYYLAVDDLEHAQQEANIAKSFEKPPDLDNWNKVQQWAWFKAFFAGQHKIKTDEIRKMYEAFSQT